MSEATSRKMTPKGTDTDALEKFKASQIKQARKLGKTEDEARAFADMMAQMYGHHFRRWE